MGNDKRRGGSTLKRRWKASSDDGRQNIAEMLWMVRWYTIRRGKLKRSYPPSILLLQGIDHVNETGKCLGEKYYRNADQEPLFTLLSIE
jgi:hypothetical protein